MYRCEICAKPPRGVRIWLKEKTVGASQRFACLIKKRCMRRGREH